jgi:hypothetical protein
LSNPLANKLFVGFPWGDRRGRVNGHLVVLPRPVPEIKKP